MRIFLDSNIVFYAAKADGAVRRLLGMLRRAGHECWVDPFVLEETRRNIVAKHPEAQAALDAELRHLRIAPRYVVDPELVSTLPVAAKDRPVLAAAILLQCSVLLTGDRTHFGAFYGRTLHGVRIHSPQSIAEAWITGGPSPHSV